MPASTSSGTPTCVDLIIGDDLIVDTVNSRVGINKLTPDANLHVVEIFVSSNLIMSDDLIIDTDTPSGCIDRQVGINKLTPDASLRRQGYVSSI